MKYQITIKGYFFFLLANKLFLLIVYEVDKWNPRGETLQNNQTLKNKNTTKNSLIA